MLKRPLWPLILSIFSFMFSYHLFFTLGGPFYFAMAILWIEPVSGTGLVQVIMKEGLLVCLSVCMSKTTPMAIQPFSIFGLYFFHLFPH